MRKWIEEYGEQLLSGVTGFMIIMLIVVSGVLSVIGARGKMPENYYGQYRDFDAFSELCQQKKPEIAYRPEKQWYAGEVISIEEAFSGKDGTGNCIRVEVKSITDRSGKDYMEIYNRKTHQIIFQKAGIYMFELNAQDKQKLCATQKIELSVDNRKVGE